jgi:prolyl oligopeptidase
MRPTIHRNRSRRCLIAIALCGVLAFRANAQNTPQPTAQPPKAPSESVTDVFHGVSVPDPYRNLEDVKRTDTQKWLNAQADFASAQLSQIPGRDELAKRIEALAKSTGDSIRGVMRMPADRIYYLKRKAGENQFKLVMRIGIDGAERVLVDPEKLTIATGQPHAINYFAPSWDGKKLAYGISAGGSEDASLHVMDIANSKALVRPIPRVHQSLVHWTPDSRSLSYNQLRLLPKGAPDSETYLDTTVFILDVSRAGAKAKPLFGPLHNRELNLERLDVASVEFSVGSAFMIARTTDTTLPEGRLFVAPIADLRRSKINWQPISKFEDKITEIKLRGDTLYLRTYAGAPRGRILALSLTDPVLSKAKEIVAEPKEGAMQSFALGKDAIYAEVQQGFNVRTYRYASNQSAQGIDVAPATPGSTYLVSDQAAAYSDVWIRTNTWTAPGRYLIAEASGVTRDTGLLKNEVPTGTPAMEVSEVEVASHDGAKVPLAIIRRKGLSLDGNNPTLLIGYGAYGFSFESYFDPRTIAWLERGGVLAYANVRGSGAFGDTWYKAGFKATKANTWKDGVACARYLIEKGFASPKTLGIMGTSAGGIFVGRTVTSAPELFAAAIFDVGIMDAVRAEESANGITNISEFGSYKNAAEFPSLLDMSTYHQIKDGTPYPAVMLIHGMNDPRVDVWHSAKAAARLQTASTSGRPILLRLDGQAGHGVGSTAKQGYSKQADIYSFLLSQFDKRSSSQ